MASVLQVLLILLCSYHSIVARPGDAHSIPKVLATGSLKAEAVCAEPQVTPSSFGRVTVPLNHRYGPCSPAPSTNMPTMAELLRRDKLRAEYLQRKFHGVDELNQSELTMPTTLGSALDTTLYFITVSIGSPPVSQNMIIDTGSDISWVQCNPCPEPSCNAPNGTLFDPLQSSTYVPFNCTSATCLQLGSHNIGCSSSQDCLYQVVYWDASNTTGTYGSDTLALTKSAGTVSDFEFGCSHDEGVASDKADGLMGLGGGVQSLVSQTAATYGKAFSYCLSANLSTPGFLTFGAPNDTSDFVTTPMLRVKGRPTFYNVKLLDIKVDGNLLGIAPSVFANGSLMDSGTTITVLPLKAYSALSSAFKASMTQYTEAPPWGVYDTCFNFTGVEKDSVTIPPVTLVFDGGAIVDLDRSGIMKSSCLAFHATTDSDGSVIGNVQQRTFEVLHDVGQSILGFRKGAC